MLPIKAEIKAEISEESQRSIIRGAANVLEPFGIGASLLSDQLAFYRFKCLVEIAEKAKALCEKVGIDPKPVQNKFLARFVEEASYEDDPDLQDMWANLLAGESRDPENIIYINILRELTKSSAVLLEEVYKNAQRSGYDPSEDFLDSTNQNIDYEYTSDSEESGFLISSASKSLKGRKTKEAKSNFRILAHMESLGLVKVKTNKFNSENGSYIYSTYAVITPLGFNFMKACKQLEEEADDRDQ